MIENREDVKKYKFNKEQLEAIKLILEGHSVFLSGPGGAGKSYIVDYLRGKMAGDIVLLAPTGVAALNIKGTTVHRFLVWPHNFLIFIKKHIYLKSRLIYFVL